MTDQGETHATNAQRSSIFGGCLNERILADEERIVWLADRAKYPYLRETTAYRNSRGGRIGMPGRKVVAYAVLQRQAPHHGQRYWDRRVWFINPQCDPYADFGHVGWPIEAVWPASIAAGQPSHGPTDAEHRAAHAADALKTKGASL
jgi:hypothetical protein